MQCPVCTTERLVMADRQGIEIDYCPKCRGVWLDRGELDKIIEKSMAVAPAAERRVDEGARQQTPPPRYPEPSHQYRDERQPPRHGKRYDDDDDDHYRYGKGRKRKSFLGDLFDFD